MKKTACLILILCFLIPIIINIITVNDGHNWGGDFSHYIRYAQNIISHKPYESDIILEPTFSYPPGFSLLIAPLIKVFGVNFKLLKFPNIFFWYATIFLLYLVFVKQIGKPLAFLCCCFLAVSSEFFIFKQNVLSDIPFLFFETCAVYLFIRYCDDTKIPLSPLKYRPFLLFLIFLAYALWIRSAGIVLFFSTIFYLLVVRRDFKASLWVIVTLCIAVSLQLLFFKAHAHSFKYIYHFPVEFFLKVISDGSLPLRTIAWILVPAQTRLTGSIFLSIEKGLHVMAPFLYLMIGVIFVRKAKRGTISYIGCFVVFFLVLMIFWTGFKDFPQRIARMMLPILGPSLMIIIGSILSLGRRIFPAKMSALYIETGIKTILILIIFLNIFNIGANYRFNDDVLFRESEQELFAWVRGNIQIHDHFMFAKPRVLNLMTQRVGTLIWSDDPSPDKSVIHRIYDLDISHLIFNKGTDAVHIQNFQGNKEFCHLVWENEFFKIFKIQQDVFVNKE